MRASQSQSPTPLRQETNLASQNLPAKWGVDQPRAAGLRPCRKGHTSLDGGRQTRVDPVYCVRCKTALQPTDVFCPKCGADQRPPSRHCQVGSAGVAAQSVPVPTACPRCGSDAAIQRVTAIVAGGAWSAEVAGEAVPSRACGCTPSSRRTRRGYGSSRGASHARSAN